LATAWSREDNREQARVTLIAPGRAHAVWLRRVEVSEPVEWRRSQRGYSHHRLINYVVPANATVAMTDTGEVISSFPLGF